MQLINYHAVNAFNISKQYYEKYIYIIHVYEKNSYRSILILRLFTVPI